MFDYERIAAIIGGALGSFVTAIVLLRRRVSSDSTGIARDGAERNLMETLISERDIAKKDAAEAWAHRTADAQMIATLQTQLAATTEQLRKLNDNDLGHRLRIRNLQRALVTLKPGALDELDSDFSPL